MIIGVYNNVKHIEPVNCQLIERVDFYEFILHFKAYTNNRLVSPFNQ